MTSHQEKKSLKWKEVKKKYGTLILSIICLILLFPPLYSRYIRIGPLPIYGQVREQGAIYLDQEGTPFKIEQLKGKTVLVNFIFTSCMGPCIPMTERMAELHRSFHLEKRIQCLSVSVNPSYDSPQVMKDFGEKHKAKFETWKFITGSEEDLKGLMAECMLTGSEEHISHSTKFVLLDHLGRIRGYYDGTDKKEMANLYKHASFLMKNKDE